MWVREKWRAEWERDDELEREVWKREEWKRDDEWEREEWKREKRERGS